MSQAPSAEAAKVRTHVEGMLGWVIIDQESKRNAMSLAMWRAIPGAFRQLSEHPAVRVIVLRGAGEVAFVSGADISEFAEVRAPENARAYEAENERAFAAIERCPKPVIAMIHGFCMGGGIGMAVAADMRIAADDARFSIPAARLGLGYPPDNLRSVIQLIGPSRTKQLFFSAERFGASAALAMGFLNEVVPKAELERRTRALADTIAHNAPLTLRSIKLTVGKLSRPVTADDEETVAAAIQRCFDSDDYREGVRAFLEKRAPVFRGE